MMAKYLDLPFFFQHPKIFLQLSRHAGQSVSPSITRRCIPDCLLRSPAGLPPPPCRSFRIYRLNAAHMRNPKENDQRSDAKKSAFRSENDRVLRADTAGAWSVTTSSGISDLLSRQEVAMPRVRIARLATVIRPSGHGDRKRILPARQDRLAAVRRQGWRASALHLADRRLAAPPPPSRSRAGPLR